MATSPGQSSSQPHPHLPARTATTFLETCTQKFEVPSWKNHPACLTSFFFLPQPGEVTDAPKLSTSFPLHQPWRERAHGSLQQGKMEETDKKLGNLLIHGMQITNQKLEFWVHKRPTTSLVVTFLTPFIKKEEVSTTNNNKAPNF